MAYGELKSHPRFAKICLSYPVAFSLLIPDETLARLFRRATFTDGEKLLPCADRSDVINLAVINED